MTGLLRHFPGATPVSGGSAHRRSHPTGKAKRTPRAQRWRRKGSYSGKEIPRCRFRPYFLGIVR